MVSPYFCLLFSPSSTLPLFLSSRLNDISLPSYPQFPFPSCPSPNFWKYYFPPPYPYQITTFTQSHSSQACLPPSRASSSPPPTIIPKTTTKFASGSNTMAASTPAQTSLLPPLTCSAPRLPGIALTLSVSILHHSVFPAHLTQVYQRVD